MRRATVILLTLPVLAECGQTSSAADFDGEERAVAEAVEELQDAVSRNDEARVCQSVLAQALIDRLEADGQDCRKEMQSAIDDTDAAALDVTDVAVTGTTATAKVEGREGEKDVTRTLRLVKERERWRIEDFGSAG
jgi:hypothetical protein